MDEKLSAVRRAAAMKDWPSVNDVLAPTVEAAVAGDRRALDELLAIVHGASLARPVVAGLLSAEVDIDDAEQMTLASIARSITKFRGDASFTTWLFTVARNEAKMVIRSQARHGQPLSVDLLPATASAFAHRISSMIARQVSVGDLIEKLGEDHAQVLRMRDLDGLSYAEIAERLGVAEGTVKSRIARARGAMRELAEDLAP